MTPFMFGAAPTAFDRLQLLLVVSALLVDALALAAIAARTTEFGFTPNRVAALGENLILLVNLAWSARLYARFLRGRGEFAALERWQVTYLPVYAAWAAIVVIVFPPAVRLRLKPRLNVRGPWFDYDRDVTEQAATPSEERCHSVAKTGVDSVGLQETGGDNRMAGT